MRGSRFRAHTFSKVGELKLLAWTKLRAGGCRASALTLFQRGRAEALGFDKASRWRGSRFRAHTFFKGGRAEALGMDKASRWWVSRFRAHTFLKGGRGGVRLYRSQMLGRGAVRTLDVGSSGVGVASFRISSQRLRSGWVGVGWGDSSDCGANGLDGADGPDGANGRDEAVVAVGPNGADGANGADEADGL